MTGIMEHPPTPRILVIDDDDGVRATLEILLEDAGLAVLTAGDGARGLELFFANRVDLVITDMHMPSRGGNEIISEIRRSGPRVPIIAMSGSGKAAGKDDLAAAARNGADRVIGKPFDYDDLSALVHALLPTRADTPEGAEEIGKHAADGGR